MRRVFTWIGDDWTQWPCPDGLSIWYKPSLDGGGSFAAPWFVQFFRRNYPNRKFRRAFEWCAGPGFIGFSLLQAGICEQLVLADINPVAVECVKRTLSYNSLVASKVTWYISDNLRDIPAHERFDLVVSNPPYATNGNPKYIHDIRTQDPGWKIHSNFFAGIKSHLDADALLCISEFCPLESNPEHDLLPPNFEQWDCRQHSPIEELLPSIRKGGLRLTGAIHATGDQAPLARVTLGSPAVALSYRDWFWILTIELDKRER